MQVFCPISWGRAGKRFVGMPNSSCLRMEWVAENDRERSLIGTHPKMWCKNSSSTSCAIGVVLHWREKLYFIVKGSSTAPKGTKTVFSFRHPKSPQKQQKCLGYPKKASRAHYIYNESVEKFHLIYKKVVPMFVKRPEPMYLCNRKQGGTLLKRVPLGFAPRKGKSSLKDLHRQRM